MKKEIVALIWSDSATRVTLRQVLNFTKDNRFFIAVNDGKDLTVGVEMLKSVIDVDSEIEKQSQSEIQHKRKLNKEKTVLSIAPIAPMPIKVKPFQHQIRAYNMALQAMGVMG